MRPEKILVATNNETEGKEILKRLEKLNKSYRLVRTKEEIAPIAASFHPQVLLISDELIQTGGRKVLHQLRNQIPHLLIIAFSGNESVAQAVKLIQQGADDYFSIDALCNLEKLIEVSWTKRQLERKQLKEMENRFHNEEKFHKLIESIEDGIIALDPSWHITYINKRAEMLLNRPRGSLTGKNIWKEFPDTVGEQFYEAYFKAHETQKIVVLDAYSMALETWVEATVYPSSAGLLVYFHDITMQKKAEKRARESEDRYRVFLDRITDGFIALDKNFNYTYANKKAGELLQRDPDSLIGKNVWEEFPEAVDSYTYKAFHTAMKEQRFITNIDYYEPLNLWQENYIYPSPQGLSVFIRDITERKKLEHELLEQERRKQLQIAATAMEAQELARTHIGQELHDNVNQILVATKLMLALIRDNPDNSMQMMPICINNLEKAIDENRKLAHELVTPDMNKQKLADQLNLLIKPMFEGNRIEANMDTSEFSEELLDAPRKLTIYRIVQEQFTNIIKHAKGSCVQLKLTTNGEDFTMVVEDNGRGMDPLKTKKGIGLKNMEARLRLFNGYLNVVTHPAQGFALKITLPLAD